MRRYAAAVCLFVALRPAVADAASPPAGGGHGVDAQPQDPLRAHYERAQSFQLAGELDRAESEFRTEVLPRALRRLGNLSGAQGRVEEAVALLEEATTLAPGDVEIQTDLAVALLRQGNVSRADAVASKALAAAPSNARVRSVFGRTRLLSGDPGRAAQELRTSLDQEGRFDTAFALAMASLALGRLEAARALFDQMTAANPSSDLLVLIGRAYLESSLPDQALEQLTLALERNRGTPDAHYYSGLAHLNRQSPHRVARARAEFEAELSIAPHHGRARKALEVLVNGRPNSTATDADRVLLELLPSASAADEARRQAMRAQLAEVVENAWHNLAVIYTQQGAADAASAARLNAQRFRAANTGTSRPSERPAESIASSEHLFESGDLDASERAVRGILEREPGRPDALRVLGLIRAAQGRHEEAEALLRRAFEKDPEKRDVLLPLARTYVARQEFSRALDAINRAPVLRQPEADALRVLAYLGLGRVADARAQLDRTAQSASPDDAAAVLEALVARRLLAEAAAFHARLRARQVGGAALSVASARLALANGDLDGAEAALDRALAQEPNSVDALQLLASVASERGDDARAADLLHRASALQPASPELLRHLIEASARAARIEEALSAARRLIAMRPDDSDARRLLALTLLQSQNWREAIEILESPPTDAARDARWALALGLAHFGRRGYEEARAAFERALQLDPGQTEARYHLGLIAREQGRTADAEDALMAVLERDPAHPGARLELGTLHLTMGDLGRARPHLECASHLDPDDPSPHYQLGLLFRRAGDEARARREMQRFEELRQKSLTTTRAGVVKRRSRKGGC